ncbi:TraH family protein [Agrobacterium salinitolerans]|uniref:TraH family protein n=1 Tax=Agrobacterium salinitolerans TaxID=1183413 RepID=UPI0015726DF1|nr:TraH family protein [Agrobacterium salinitolerans]NTA40332.1 conjugal transfer protein TraH [Agrobacterium salinitolerans]
MIDMALIEKCADPSLTPAIVEQFINAAGSDDPLAISVRIGGRLVLVPKPADPAMGVDAIRTYVGQASVRVGITQFPAGVGITETSQLTPEIFDPCSNLRTGTALFAKVARIVTKWYGRPTNPEVLPQMMDDAIYAWQTGLFEGTRVFQVEDPGGPTFINGKSGKPVEPVEDSGVTDTAGGSGGESTEKMDASKAGIRVDLSRIGGR